MPGSADDGKCLFQGDGSAEKTTSWWVLHEYARQGAERINGLLAGQRVVARRVDVENGSDLDAFLTPLQVCASAVPYSLNLRLAKRTVAASTSFCDLGGNAAIVEQELDLDAEASRQGVSVGPDCGVGPGMISNLAMLAFQQFDTPREIVIYDGGLPTHPLPPFFYKCFFNLEGLTNEYDGDAQYLLKGRITPVAAFHEKEFEAAVRIPGVGELEAFTTSGGLTTIVRTLEGRLRTLKNKTLRYPGHYALMKGLIDLGMLSQKPVTMGGREVAPRQFLHQILASHFTPAPAESDLMVIHIRATGVKDGRARTLQIDMLDYLDPATGFSAMERTTGYHMAIIAQAIGGGEVGAGAVPPELAIDPDHLVEELARRDIQVRMAWV